jgi:hypothetical protein
MVQEVFGMKDKGRKIGEMRRKSGIGGKLGELTSFRFENPPIFFLRDSRCLPVFVYGSGSL